MVAIDVWKIEQYNKKVKEKNRKDFMNLLLDDKVIRNNRVLQEKYMELYDNYTST